ncbi:hypothetical protein VTH82DRAFT_8016 [Thermothelomyces myriococcoides]
MKPSSAVLLLALAPGAWSTNVVEFSVSRSLPGNHTPLTLSRLGRREAYSERLINSIAGGGYYVQVQVGSPPQNLTMLLDTGSSDAWVLSHDADLCTSPDLQEFYGMTCIDTYDPSKSSSKKMVKKDGFKITYLDGGTASGDYITDHFTIGGVTIRSLQMAYVTKAVRGTGILGLGFSVSERASTKYPNLIDEMYNQGLIKSKAFSLYLNDRRTDSGSILFGGIDTDKFIGPLGVLPLQKAPGSKVYSSFEVNFTSVSLVYTNDTRHIIPTAVLNHPAPAVLDSGTTLSYLPYELADPINAALDTFYDDGLQMTLIDCFHPMLRTDPNFHLVFTFTPTTSISVPLDDLILDILPSSYHLSGSDNSNENADDDDDEEDDDDDDDDDDDEAPTITTEKKKWCVFGIQSTARFATSPGQSEVNFTLLGDTFLRSAYVVYDLSHYQIGLAQANLNSSSSSNTTSTIVELSAADDDSASGRDESAGPTRTVISGGLPSGLMGVEAQQTTFTPTATANADPGFGGGEEGLYGSAGPDSEENAAAAARRTGLLSEVVGVAAVTALFTLFGGALIAI